MLSDAKRIKTLNIITYYQNMLNINTQALQIYNISYVEILSDAKRINLMYAQLHHHTYKLSKETHTKMFHQTIYCVQ